MQLSYLFTIVSAALASLRVVSSSPVASIIMTEAEFDYWLATTDAELTFIGGAQSHNPLAKRDAQFTKVTYCNKRVHNVCGGACTVYQGGAKCLNAPNTSCLAATTNVGFCDREGCGHSCNQLSTCGVHLDGGFCYTPGTRSILVPA